VTQHGREQITDQQVATSQSTCHHSNLLNNGQLSRNQDEICQKTTLRSFTDRNVGKL